MIRMITVAAMSAVVLAGCATSPKSFYESPEKQDVTALCRAVIETKDTKFQRDVAAELVRRGMTLESCQEKISQQNTAIAAVALVGTVAAVGVIAANGGGGGGGYSAPASSGPDYDCLGGSGDGPLYIKGPVRVGSYDPYRLDANNNGIGCEVADIAYGR